MFLVVCERIGRRKAYKVSFSYHPQVVERIKELPSEDRKWDGIMQNWELSTRGLYSLIKRYKGSDKIYFDFGGRDSKNIFINQIKEIEREDHERKEMIADLEKKKLHWVKWKNELEENYLKYWDRLHKHLKEGVKLYPHQVIAAMFLNEVKSALISHEMGLGKTLASIAYVEMNDFEKAFVITPNSLKFNYFNEVEKFTDSKAHIVNWKKNKHSIEESKYVIVNYEFFNKKDKRGMDKKWKELGIGEIDVLVADECFSYNTKIWTNIGELKIGDIVENSLDVKVLTYNHRLNKIELKTINRYLFNGIREVFKLNLSDGSVIECTPEHKFYSYDRNEYIPIKYFKNGEKILKRKNLPTMWYEFPTQKKQSKILLKKMFNKKYRQRKRKNGVGNSKKEWEFKSYCCEKLSILWRKFRSTGKNKKTFLFYKLFGKVENESERNKRKSTQQGNIQKDIHICCESTKGKSTIKGNVFKKDEIKQSDVQERKHREDEKKEKRSNFFIERWKWAINKTTNKTIFKTFRRNNTGNEDGIFTTNKKTIKRNGCECEVTTNPLQNRYWNSFFKVRNRNRWKHSQIEEVEISRQKENGDFELIWVENIEVLEQRNRRKFGGSDQQNKKVYDLEIVDNHNYFADGILVSNCHRLKNTKANTYKNFKRIFGKPNIFRDKKISKVFLTGTPAPNRAYELYTVLNQISPLDFATKKQFYEYYLGMVYDYNEGWGYVESGEKHLEQLYHKIAPYTHRKRKKEVLTDLPDKIYQRVILEMNDSEYSTYNDIEEGVANEFTINPVANPLTVMLRLRQHTSHIKTKSIKELIENVLDTGEKIVVVDVFKETLLKLYDIFPNISGLHTGDQSVEERAEIVKKFQDPNSDMKIFIGSIQTCNYGLTLTAADKLFIMTLPYSVGEYDQVSDRLHRIGQKNVVNIYPLIFPDTIDDYVYSSIESKRAEIVKVIDNEDYTSDVSESVLSDVINKIKGKHKKIINE